MGGNTRLSARLRPTLAISCLALLAFSVGPLVDYCWAWQQHHEKYYQKLWCDAHGGKTEYVLPDRTRVDCLTKKYAIEVEWAENWAEAVGQALYYARMTNKEPGIVLLFRNDADFRFLDRLSTAIQGLRIKIFLIETLRIKQSTSLF